MDVFYDFTELELLQQSVITVGAFDGVHKGHQSIIRAVTEQARLCGSNSTLVTFHPHPATILVPGKKYDLLTTLEEKLEIFKELGLDRVVVISFTDEFRQLDSLQFVCDILFKRIGFCDFVIGYDHAFGKNREGTVSTLRSLADELKFNVIEVPELVDSDFSIKSSSIRQLLKRGEVKSASYALGRPFELRGMVVVGQGRGRMMGYPTANIHINSSDKLIPRPGVYAVKVQTENNSHHGMCNIGFRPTFNDNSDMSIEAHIFERIDDLYDKQIHIQFMEYVRDEQKFNSMEELKIQLDDDRQVSRRALNAFE